MNALSTHADMLRKIRDGRGFIAALDQSGGSSPKALAGYGISGDAFSSDEEMFALIHAMRSRIIRAPCFSSGKVIGAILFERTMDGVVDGQPTVAALRGRGVVPFIKIDKGLEDEANGVQLMRPMPELSALLTRARALGVFGTKERSVINGADPEGIAAAVAQQFAVAQQVLAHELMPILEPEVNIKSLTRAECDRLLLREILMQLDGLADDQQVMLKLSLPAVPGTFDTLVSHRRVLRVVALSGGYSRADACRELAKNRGVIASFSRALLSDLRADMDDATFDASLRQAVADIHAGSLA